MKCQRCNAIVTQLHPLNGIMLCDECIKGKAEFTMSSKPELPKDSLGSKTIRNVDTFLTQCQAPTMSMNELALKDDDFKFLYKRLSMLEGLIDMNYGRIQDIEVRVNKLETKS